MCTHGWWRVMELRTYKSLHISHPGELTKNADTQGSTSRDPDSAAPSGAWAFVLLLNPPWWSPKRIYPSPLWGFGWGSQVLKMHTLAEHVLAFPRLLLSLSAASPLSPIAILKLFQLLRQATPWYMVSSVFLLPGSPALLLLSCPPPSPGTFPTGKTSLPTLHPRLGWRPLAPVFCASPTASVLCLIESDC